MADRRDVHLEVKGMTCQGCVNAVTRVVQRKDPSAQVKVDLATGRVDGTSEMDADALAKAITGAGYEARVV
jgi:copper chaperone